MSLGTKSYDLTAKAVAQSRQQEIGAMYNTVWQLAIDRVAYLLAGAFHTDNPNFKTEKFLKACGVKS
jgi:hypothetical protein